MFEHEQILAQPVFFLFIAFSFLLSFGYFWGRRQNKKLFLSAFNDLADVVKPDDQTFTNIGGVIGYHASFFVRKKGAFLSRVDATITMLPRHSWLYFPISKIISKYDRLFITLYLKQNPSGEGHLIEKKYAAFRGPKITNEQRLNKETINWGNYDFFLYYENTRIRDHFIKFMELNPEPATIKHIAIIPDQKKGFVFMIPHKKKVAQYFAPIYQWLPSVIKQ
ncbi:MAG: hypothetical protein JRC90_07315 [Deltaproteobacteria bacterium]|nr:hypothetical protein [Deltaproteobacteria bacterium]